MHYPSNCYLPTTMSPHVWTFDFWLELREASFTALPSALRFHRLRGFHTFSVKMSDKTPKSSREAVRPDMRVLNQQLTFALFFRPWNPAASDKSPSSSNPATSSGPTLFSKPPPPALLKPDSAASTGAGGVFGMPPPSRPPAEGAALFSKPASAQSQGGSGLFGKNLSSSGTGTSGLIYCMPHVL